MRVYSRFRCISGLSPKQVASVIFRQFLKAECAKVFRNSPWAARRLLSHSQLNLPGRPAGGEGEREGAPEERVMLEFGIFC